MLQDWGTNPEPRGVGRQPRCSAAFPPTKARRLLNATVRNPILIGLISLELEFSFSDSDPSVYSWSLVLLCITCTAKLALNRCETTLFWNRSLHDLVYCLLSLTMIVHFICQLKTCGQRCWIWDLPFARECAPPLTCDLSPFRTSPLTDGSSIQ